MEPRTTEQDFFYETLQRGVKPEQLFYRTSDHRYLAYWPKDYQGKKATLQSRSAFIGEFTERWVEHLLQPLADQIGAFAKRGVICSQFGLTKRSPADVAIVRKDQPTVDPEDFVLIVEVKMSIVWNWEYDPDQDRMLCIGDLTTHEGTPGLLRSDTVLKAIGKSLNIRISDAKSVAIPIFVFGNTPLSQSYHTKVDLLKKFGIVQGFFSLNPRPLDDPAQSSLYNLKRTPSEGFLRIDSVEELYHKLRNVLSDEREFFASMISKAKLGKIIERAYREPTDRQRAERFLQLLREPH